MSGNPDLAQLAATAAYTLTAANPAIAHLRDELEGQGILWCLEHPRRVQRAFQPSGGGPRRVHAEIQRHLVAWSNEWARQSRPPAAGTDPGATVRKQRGGTYTTELVLRSLPVVFDRDYQPPAQMPGMPRQHSDPRNRINPVLIRLDLTNAAHTLTPDEHRAVGLHVWLGFSRDETAQLMGVAGGRVTALVQRAVQRIVERLDEPWFRIDPALGTHPKRSFDNGPTSEA